jgi:ribosome-associated protein
VHLRFDIAASSLPAEIKERLLALSDSRITQSGVLVLKAQQHRTQEMNRSDALARLQEVVDSVAVPPKARRATKPTFGSKQRRLEGKSLRSDIKNLRGKVQE